MDTELINLLNELDVVGNEQKLYIAGLELGPTTITELARKAEVERATVYALLEKLAEKGLTGEQIEPRHVQMESPDKLLILLRRKREKMAEDEKKFKEILPDLLSQVNARGKKPKVRFFEGKEQFINLYDSILDEAKDKIHFCGDASIFVRLISSQFEESWVRRRKTKQIHIDVLAFKTPLTEGYQKDDKNQMRTTRFLPQDMRFESSFMLYTNKVIFWNPIVPLAIALEDEIIAQMMLEMFLKLWIKKGPA